MHTVKKTNFFPVGLAKIWLVTTEKIKRQTLTENSELAPYLALFLHVNTRPSTVTTALNPLDLFGFSNCSRNQCNTEREKTQSEHEDQDTSNQPPRMEIKGSDYVLKNDELSDLEELRLEHSNSVIKERLFTDA